MKLPEWCRRTRRRAQATTGTLLTLFVGAASLALDLARRGAFLKATGIAALSGFIGVVLIVNEVLLPAGKEHTPDEDGDA